jgi:hypothetical protein
MFFSALPGVVTTQGGDETWNEAKCQRRVLPLLAFAQHADAEILRKNLFLRLKGQSP